MLNEFRVSYEMLIDHVDGTEETVVIPFDKISSYAWLIQRNGNHDYLSCKLRINTVDRLSYIQVFDINEDTVKDDINATGALFEKYFMCVQHGE